MVILIGCLHYKSHFVLVEQRCVHADISHAYSSRETTTFSSKILLGYFIWCPCKKGLSLVCSYLLQNGCRQCGTPVLLCGCYATVQLALFFKASFFKCTHHAHPHTCTHTHTHTHTMRVSPENPTAAHTDELLGPTAAVREKFTH